MKHAIIFTIQGDVDLDYDKFEDYMAGPPSGQQWSTLGLRPTEDFDPTYFEFERQERVLPSSVINAESERLFAQYEQREGRKPGKKARAIIKADLIGDMLPKAFIKVSHIAASFTGGRLIVWTSSMTKADDIVTLFVAATDCNAKHMPVTPSLAAIALGRHDRLLPGSTAVLKGHEKERVRIKDLSIESHRVQPLIEVDGYDIAELQVYLDHDRCVLTDKGVVKAIEVVGDEGDDVDDGARWMVRTFIDRLIVACDEDDEL